MSALLELAGIEHPGSTFRGRKVHLPRGKSWVPHLLGKADAVHAENAIHGCVRASAPYPR